ncbi:hypothetical protein Clacol_002543 [Clathrus columnatus]|uniref:INO80 complex subunit B-like conserved region domain-containing protein n=1 Tax=Clathrus columnatus TaxID=1419009 RepID=A0AAV5A3Y9_9AGAM|nr:hypothetical protein Clacol_002543 [Clathrus columnatus]
MPRVMVHPRFKQRIISDPPSATASPESGHPVDSNAVEQGVSADVDMAEELGPNEEPAEDVDDEGGSMDISDDEDVGDEAEESQGYEPGSNRGHALSRFNPQKPASSSQNNNKSLKVSASASGSSSALHPVTMADQQDNLSGTQRPSEQQPDSVRRSSRVKQPPSPSKPAPVNQRSPARRSLKIKLKLGSKPTPELDDEKLPAPSTVTRSGGTRRGRASRARGRGKDTATLTFTLPARGRNTRSEASVSSRRSQSPSETSPRTSPESEDDPDAEIDIDPDPEGEAEDVNIDEPDDEAMGVGSIDEDGDDDDSEVLPGQGSRSRMTSRQALLANKADVEHVELGSVGPSRKKQLTTEEMALRREETARKRKNLNEKKLEDEKTETINRLLKKQSSRSRAKRSALNASVVATPQTHSGGEEGENDQIPPERSSGMPGPAWRWISSKDGYKLGIPVEVIEDVTMESLPVPPRPPLSASICDAQGCSRSRKYRLVSDFNRGACGIEHLKLLNGTS